jgi:hypothetical protein
MGPMTGKMKFVTFRWTLFNCLLVGSLVWISYRAALTSELSVVKTKLPFTDLKTLAETDYRLLLSRKNTAVSHRHDYYGSILAPSSNNWAANYPPWRGLPLTVVRLVVSNLTSQIFFSSFLTTSPSGM